MFYLKFPNGSYITSYYIESDVTFQGRFEDFATQRENAL